MSYYTYFKIDLKQINPDNTSVEDLERTLEFNKEKCKEYRSKIVRAIIQKYQGEDNNLDLFINSFITSYTAKSKVEWQLFFIKESKKYKRHAINHADSEGVIFTRLHNYSEIIERYKNRLYILSIIKPFYQDAKAKRRSEEEISYISEELPIKTEDLLNNIEEYIDDHFLDEFMMDNWKDRISEDDITDEELYTEENKPGEE